jgi:proline dehydrogenase
MVNFQDTKIAFERKSDKELKKTAWLFGMMSKNWLVSLGSKLTLFALRIGLPVQGLIRNTIFEQFCGGTSLEDSKKTVQALAAYGVETVLDYGAEAKESEADFDNTLNEFLKVVEFAAENKSVEIISAKVTGIARLDILEKITSGIVLSADEQKSWDVTIVRLDKLCKIAFEKKVAIFIDAEESWIQTAIDDVTDLMMERYNKESVIVYNTFQLYRHDRLEFLKKSFEKATEKGYVLGAKLVRGAYMEKERLRAAEKGYQSPIQPDKAATDRDYDLAVKFCVENYEKIASCVASHNQKSTEYQISLMSTAGLASGHPHLSFCQLYGMSDNLTFNLAKAGFRVGKYVPFGPIKDVVPYLIRRAQENSSVNGEVGRELKMIREEQKRRRNNK